MSVYRAFQFSLVVAISGMIPSSVDAQVRFFDRMQTQPQAPSRWETAIHNAQEGRAAVGRRMKRESQSSQAQPNLTHDQALAMPHWTSAFTSEGATYPFTVIGSDPSKGTSTTIPTVIVPYRLVFPDGGVFDATTDLVDGVTPLAGIVNSPIFQPVPWTVGSTQVGTTQFGDAMLRANFWSSIPGNRSGYHVLLAAPQILPVQVVNVPAGLGISTVDSHGVKVGVVDFAWLAETTAKQTVNLGIPPQALAIHLMSAVEGQDLNGGGSLGFHDSINVGSATNPVIQPYIQTGYFSQNSAYVVATSNASGTGVLGHEIAEWLNDPVGDSFVPAWQDPAFPHLCDNSFLEVGDPLEYISRGFGVSLNGRTYQFPEVAFLPWFAGDRHSTSVNGWYSSLNTFSSPSTACPVFTNFGFFGFDFTGAATSVLTGVSNSVNNKMTMVGYAESASSSLTGIQMDVSLDPASGAITFANLQQVYLPASQVTVPIKVNDAGQIVGFYLDSGGKSHGFLLSKGRYSTIDFPGAIATEALAINNWPIPAIAGNYTDAGGKVHGFVTAGGLFVPINAGFATNLSVTGINDFGQMAGVYDLGGPLGTAPTFGFTGTAGFLTPLDYSNSVLTPATTSTLLNSLNNRNEIAGTVTIQFQTGFLRVEAFLEGGGNFQPLEAGLDGFLADQALGINDAGVMVGSFQDLTGIHAAIAIPTHLFSGAVASLSTPVVVPIPWK
jgi:hypothetical protein